MAVRGGLTRFARPAGSPLTAFTVCPTGCRQLSVGVVLLDPQVGLVVQQAVEHIGGIADADIHHAGAERGTVANSRW